jgi:uncharacterized protein
MLHRFFKPKPDRFHELIIEQASMTLLGLEALIAYMASPGPEAAKDVVAVEKEADEVRRILIDELNRTFVTPIDREDIFALSGAIDDMLDYAKTTVDEMELLKIRPTTYMVRLAELLRDAAYEIHQATLRLKENPNVAGSHAQRAKALENQVEVVYREALVDLFSKPPQDVQQVLEILKDREISRHLSNAADRVDVAANIIANVVVKIA